MKNRSSIERAKRTPGFGTTNRLLLVLDNKRYDALMRMLDNPPAPGPKLRSLLRRTPAWQR